MPMRISKEKDSPIVICSCGKLVYEVDTLFCKRCGDVMCYDCATLCIHCDQLHCVNCTENHAECIRCYLDQPRIADKAFLVIDGKSIPIKNSEFMIKKTSIPNARDLILKLDGKTFQYRFRSICEQKDNKAKFDYFITFEEIIEDRLSEDRMDWSPYLGNDSFEEDIWNEMHLPLEL